MYKNLTMLLPNLLLLGQLSNETWIEVESEVLKFKKLSEMPISDSDDDDDGRPQIGHSQSDLFIHKQSVSDKMVADCVESLIGTYVYVSMNNTNIF